MNISIHKIHEIRDAVNRQKELTFKKYNWEINHLLSAGDIRLVLEILEVMGIDLHFRKRKLNKNKSQMSGRK